MSTSFAVSRKSLVEQVSDGLVEFILEAGLREGEQLPSTADLAARFGVSRTVVREAVAELAARGILVRSHGREATVGTPGSDELTSLLSFRVRRDNLSPADVQDIREGVEVVTARLAAAKRTSAHLALLRRHIAEMEAADDDMGFHEADVAFHRVIAEASGNQLLTVLLDALHPLLLDERIRATAGRRATGGGLDEIIAAHRAILSGIEAGDAEAAKQAMESHLVQVREGLTARKRRRR